MSNPILMSAMFSLNRIFEASRVPISTPLGSLCITLLYCNPPKPSDNVAHTFGIRYTAAPQCNAALNWWLLLDENLLSPSAGSYVNSVKPFLYEHSISPNSPKLPFGSTPTY